ncbi:hypothetical protein [Neogemmobacter tilapiae]|uniref:Uncharacterized protein n=1 Tax=Neogemmobacter tilapiae TaxID=875041 RepID=A0A918TJX1_9RHOB|nr:hypothetical protein [Gemmobacter tilapiae]GHC49072.1 hypothetical protein GCM10007315_08960 [Gemmobacter tilapiae]
MFIAARLFSTILYLSALALPAWAQQSEVVFSSKAWQVEIVAFDDGTFGCVAHVTKKQGSFSIWIFQDDTARLQFFSDEWNFDGGYANYEVQIDKRAAWTLTNAEQYQQSILFNLPNSDDGGRFVGEVAAGNTIVLRGGKGKKIRQFSLAGSRASMGALGECGDTIIQDARSGGGGGQMDNGGAAQGGQQGGGQAGVGGQPPGGNRVNPFQ